jgi:serine/threonine protein kinase
MENRAGQHIGNYRLVRLLGQGGFANVYLAEHLHLNTQAAIKILQMRLVGNNMEQFRSEAQAIASLVHPHIVRVLDFGVEDGIPFLVMDYAAGGTLRSRHPRGTRLPPDIIVSYVKQVAEALQYAHDKNLIHRDVKPENMLLGQNNTLLLSDFGLVLVAQSWGSRGMKEIAGTVPYMAPEQIQGKPRAASDQYALGIVVYEWLSGTTPFEGAPLELYGQHLHASPPSLRDKIPELPPPVEEVVMTALAKDPQQRFAEMRTFAAALEQSFQGAQPPFSGSPIASPRLYQSLPATVVDASLDQRAELTYIETSPGQPIPPTMMNTVSGQSSLPPSQDFSQFPKTELALPVADRDRSAGSSRSKAGRWWLAFVLVLLALLLIFGSIVYAMPGGFASLTNKFLDGSSSAKGSLAASSATVTITPESRDLKNLYTISAVTGTPDASKHQVAARLLFSTTQQQSKTVNATGSTTIPGVRATGELTLSNGLFSDYTVAAGTVFTDSQGVQVESDTQVVVPGGSDTSYGMATVSAHAVNVGVSGDIPAGDLNSTCCGSGMVYVGNAAGFTGGKDPQQATTVQQSDIDGAANALEAANTPDPQQVLQGQVHTNERFAGNPQCEPNVTSNHAAGEVATSVTVSVTFTCTGEVYDQQGALTKASDWLKQDAAKNPGTGYALVGNVVTTQTKAKVSNADQGTIAVFVTAEGIWVFQVSNALKLSLAKLIAGKKKEAAQSLLLQQGVSKVDIQLLGGDRDTFPKNIGQIKFVVLSVKGK